MSQVLIPAADMVAVIVEDKAEEVGTAEETVEGTSSCTKTTRMSNGRISWKRIIHIPMRLGRRRRIGIRNLHFLQGQRPTRSLK